MRALRLYCGINYASLDNDVQVEVEHSGIIKSVAMDTATELLHLGTSVILHLETELALALSSMKQNAVLADSLKKRVCSEECQCYFANRST